MKTMLPLLLILAVFSCTKPDSSQDITAMPQHADTGEYFMFTLKGDSFNEEKIVMDKGILNSFARFNGNNDIISFSCPGNGMSFSAYIHFKIKPKGTIALDTINNISSFIFSHNTKGSHFIKSLSGKLTIIQFPDSINDYAKGSFSGSYVDIYGSKIKFTITNGSFRIKRKE